MVNYICIYFSSATYVQKGSRCLSKQKVPHRILKLSEELSKTGCNQCILVVSAQKERALSALNEEGVEYLSVKAVDRL